MKHHPDDAAHVARCDDCQARATFDGLDVDLEKVWTGVAAEAWSSPVSRLERLASRLLRSPALARTLATTPSLFISWLLATVAILGAGVLATPASGEPWAALLAPALAGAGIAYAYGPGVDPAFELNRTMATSDRMVLLVRSLAVFGLNAALGLVASLFSAATVGITLVWLLPMTTVCALALAVATLARSAMVGVGAALMVWGFVVTAVAARTRDMASAVEMQSLMPVYAVSTVVLILLTLYATGGRGGGLSWR